MFKSSMCVLHFSNMNCLHSSYSGRLAWYFSWSRACLARLGKGAVGALKLAVKAWFVAAVGSSTGGGGG